MSSKMAGLVRWFGADESFSFTTPDDSSKGVLIHLTAVRGNELHILGENQKIEFFTERGQYGLVAANVVTF